MYIITKFIFSLKNNFRYTITKMICDDIPFIGILIRIKFFNHIVIKFCLSSLFWLSSLTI